MRLWNGEKVIEAALSTGSAASPFSEPVLVVGGAAYGAVEVSSWYVLEATDEEVKNLVRGGYLLPGPVTLARDLGFEAALAGRELDDARERLRKALGREETSEEAAALVAGWGHLAGLETESPDGA